MDPLACCVRTRSDGDLYWFLSRIGLKASESNLFRRVTCPGRGRRWSKGRQGAWAGWAGRGRFSKGDRPLVRAVRKDTWGVRRERGGQAENLGAWPGGLSQPRTFFTFVEKTRPHPAQERHHRMGPWGRFWKLGWRPPRTWGQKTGHGAGRKRRGLVSEQKTSARGPRGAGGVDAGLCPGNWDWVHCRKVLIVLDPAFRGGLDRDAVVMRGP